MKKGSIAVRLFWLSAVWLVLALAATAILLSNLYSEALDRSLSETLDFHIETLAGQKLDAEAAGEIGLADPRFARPASGWYWEIRNEQGVVTDFSRSLLGTQMPVLDGPFDRLNRRSDTREDAFGTRLRLIERRVTIADQPLTMAISGNLDELVALVDAFRGQAFVVLGAVGVMLAIMSAIVARIALRPIGRLSAAVEAVREGEAETVEGAYPAELAPLAEEVNELLRSNARIIERAQAQVGNLAHGLKTPLAVLRNEATAQKGEFAVTVADQIRKMGEIVSTYLDRARLSARTSVVGKRANISESLRRMTRVMQKLHPARAIELTLPPGPDLWFRGDGADLEEIIGNLVDNACKFSRTDVKLTLAPGPGRTLMLEIADDGAGLTPEQAAQVMRRGVRLDEKVPGSGLGLDIVKELIDVYGGALALERSAQGGLLVRLTLPAARSGPTP